MLSATDAGLAWIDNFPDEDQSLARRLLDRLVLDSWTDARAKLLDLLRKQISEQASKGPLWVIPLMDDGDIRRAKGLPKFRPIVTFDDFEPGMDISTMPGSEGLIGHLIRDVQASNVIAPTADLGELLKRKVRTIIITTDTVETGGQVNKYVAALLRNPTLRSWHSYKLIKLIVVAYAVSDEGRKAVSRGSSAISMHFVRSAPTIRTLPWTSAEIAEAILLCERHGRGSGVLGYLSHAGLFGFQDRVPNTVPRIFRQQGTDWSPLFEGKGGRLVPTEIIYDLARSPVTAIDHSEVVAAVRQERLSLSIAKQQRESNRDILAVLSLLRISPRRADLIGLALNLGAEDTERLLAYLLAQGWTRSDRSLTDAGLAELAAGKRKPRRVEPRSTTPTTNPYYPDSLR